MVPIVPETGNFRNDFPENFRNNIPERYGNFRFTKKNRSGIPVFRNLFHNGNGKISGSFPHVSVTRNSGGYSTKNLFDSYACSPV